MKPTLYYMASPFTHKDEKIQEERYNLATKASVGLLKHGIYVFAPIAYNGSWTRFELPPDWSFWEPFDKCFVDRCDALLILKIDGWKESVGINAEIEYAKEQGKSIHYVTLEQIESGDLDHLIKSYVK